MTAVDQVNRRNGWSAPTRAQTRKGYALLASYLGGLNEHADHPRAELRMAIDRRPPWCGQCDQKTRWLDPNADLPRKCPRCSNPN
jgi:hypothetical protein